MEVFEDGFLVDLARGFFRFLEILKEESPCLGRILTRKKILGRDFSLLRGGREMPFVRVRCGLDLQRRS